MIQSSSAQKHLFVFLLAVSLMISPDILVIASNFFGHTGYGGIALTLLSAGLYILFISIRNNFNDQNAVTGFSSFSSTLQFMVRIIMVAFIGTGLLVSSGFVFNEIFVYWFPNFLFAFILLLALVMFQFFSSVPSMILQAAFVTITILGFLVLIFSGFGHTPLSTSTTFDISMITTTGAAVWVTPLLFFVGVDLGTGLMNDPNSEQIPRKLTILFMTALFILWGLMGIKFIPFEKLSTTTIPHILIAKKILGDTGRYIIGATVITGSLAAVHGLFSTIKQDFQIRFRMSDKPIGANLLIIVIGLAISGLMAGGLAGYEVLESLIRATFILYLISYAVQSGHLLNRAHRSTARAFREYVVFAIFSLGSIILIVTHQTPWLIIKFVTISLIVTIVIHLVYQFILRRTNQSQPLWRRYYENT